MSKNWWLQQKNYKAKYKRACSRLMKMGLYSFTDILKAKFNPPSLRIWFWCQQASRSHLDMWVESLVTRCVMVRCAACGDEVVEAWAKDWIGGHDRTLPSAKKTLVFLREHGPNYNARRAIELAVRWAKGQEKRKSVRLLKAANSAVAGRFACDAANNVVDSAFDREEDQKRKDVEREHQLRIAIMILKNNAPPTP